MRTAGKLTDTRLRAAGVGIHGDGGGLYLAVKKGSANLTRSWLFRYSIGGIASALAPPRAPCTGQQETAPQAGGCSARLLRTALCPPLLAIPLHTVSSHRP